MRPAISKQPAREVRLPFWSKPWPSFMFCDRLISATAANTFFGSVSGHLSARWSSVTDNARPLSGFCSKLAGEGARPTPAPRKTAMSTNPILTKYRYHRRLPHIQKADADLFITFCTLGRVILPEQARTLVLEHCLREGGVLAFASECGAGALAREGTGPPHPTSCRRSHARACSHIAQAPPRRERLAISPSRHTSVF